MVIDLIVIGVAMALYPVALTIFILIVASSNGPRNGAGFIFGWLVSLAAIAVVTVLATGNKPPASGTSPSLGILVAKIVLGLALLGIAERQRRRMGRRRPTKKEPAWRARLDEMSTIFAVGLGVIFQPSVLVVTAAAAITGAKLSSAADYVSLVVFGLVSVSSYLSMEIYVLVRPTQSTEALANLNAWIDRHTDLIIVVGASLLGLWLIGHSAYLLAA
jgi:Sap, sulfolipid-1-addressing protein